MAEGDPPWRSHEPDLARAVESWRRRESPSVEQVEAFYDWCLGVAGTGPRDADTLPVPGGDPDAYVSRVPGAGALVTYLAVAQDSRIFLRAIESTTT